MKVHTLGNGIRVAITPLKGIKSITVKVNLKLGAKYENKDEFGLSHYLEHMAFKGTSARPGATDIFKEIDSKGAMFNAETGYENTSYEITTNGDNQKWALELLSDILLNSTYPDKEAQKEKGVIIEEIKMYQDNPMIGLVSEATDWLWGESKIGCWDISGKISEAKKFNRKKLIDYKNKYFNGKEIVVTVAGNVEEDQWTETEKYFDKNLNFKGVELPEVKVELTKETEKIIQKPTEQAHFGVMAATFGSQDERRYVLKLLNVIVAGNTSSRLFEEIRSKRGWAYYVYPIGEEIREAGFWGVQAGVPVNKLREAIELTEKTIINLKSDISEDEVKRAKDYIRGKTELYMDKSSFWADYVGENILLDDEWVSPVEELNRLEKVSKKEIAELAEKIFKAENIKRLIRTSKI